MEPIISLNKNLPPLADVRNAKVACDWSESVVKCLFDEYGDEKTERLTDVVNMYVNFVKKIVLIY